MGHFTGKPYISWILMVKTMVSILIISRDDVRFFIAGELRKRSARTWTKMDRMLWMRPFRCKDDVRWLSERIWCGFGPENVGLIYVNIPNEIAIFHGGIMISKTIGYNGVHYFQTHLCEESEFRKTKNNESTIWMGIYGRLHGAGIFSYKIGWFWTRANVGKCSIHGAYGWELHIV